MGVTVITVGRDPKRGAAVLERIRSAAGSMVVELMLARIVNVGASAHQFARRAAGFDDLQGQHKYFGWGAYGQSKLCNLLFTYELARRLDGTRVTVNALHPGVVATNFGMSGGGMMLLFNRLMSVAMLHPEQGAQTVVYLAASPEVEGVSGKYFVNRKAVRSSRASYDAASAARLWQVSEEMCGRAKAG